MKFYHDFQKSKIYSFYIFVKEKREGILKRKKKRIKAFEIWKLGSELSPNQLNISFGKPLEVRT